MESNCELGGSQATVIMAPKVQKSEQKAREKIAEDKTFGLKNKNKSKQVQKYVAQVKANATLGNVKGGASMQMNKEKEASQKKDAAAKAALLYAQLFGADAAKKAMGVAVNVASEKTKTAEELKAEQKINWYVDIRDQRGAAAVAAGCHDWSDQQIRDYVVDKLSNAPTSIICKHYIEAIRNNQIGWRWVCPNGGDDCKYLHFLLPGFELNKVRRADEDEDDEPIDEKLERERAALPPGGTPVTLETFTVWKKQQEEKRINAIKAELAVAEGKKKGGHGTKDAAPVLSGKDLFTFNPDLFVDDEGAVGGDMYEEDQAYWAQVQADNQAAVDKANEDALKMAFEDGMADVFADEDDVNLDDLEDDE